MHEKLKQSGLFVLKAASFSLIFGIVWVFAIRPFISAESASNSCNSQTQDQSVDNEAAMKKYMEQTAKADEQFKRMDAILGQKEEQGRRFDAVLSAWEKQAKITK